MDIKRLKSDEALLKELREKKQEALKSGDIVGLYELLDTFLLLELDEDIDAIFQRILEVAFDELANRLTKAERFDLRNELDLNVARAVYEHALERWDSKDFKGANELFLVLSYLVDDEAIKRSLLVSLGLTAQKEPLERFLEEFVDREKLGEESYFFDALTKSADHYIKEYAPLIERELQKARNWAS